MDQTARLLTMRDYLDVTIERNRRLTKQALITEAHLRCNGNPDRIARMLTSDADTSNVAD
jgi:hypothetical protein